MSERIYDVVIFGATGFTGGLTAEYLAEHAPPATRWAVAGRSEPKLRALAERLATRPCPPAGVLVADVADDASLAAMAASTRVVCTTVGPFAEYGEAVVRACVEAATDYLDITGEPQFVDRMITRYDAAAREKGVKVVSCCGFDSIPHDLGVLFTIDQLPRGVAAKVEGFVTSRGTFSGGTWHSAVRAFSRFREYARSEKPSRDAGPGRTVRGVRPKIHYEPELGAWACPLPTIDPQVVLRSARLLDEYGPAFSYGHYVKVKRLPTLAVGVTAVGALFALAQLPPTRALLLKVKAPGEGPSEEERARAWFRVTFLAEAAGRTIVTEVSGGDPGYTETSKMLAESALCLAFERERTPKLHGVITPAAAMGRPLIARLERAGIQFRVLRGDIRRIPMRFDTKLLPVVGLAALLGACGGDDDSRATSTETTAQAEPAAPRSLREIAGDTWEPLPTEVEVNREKMLLGRSLFHDTRLSGDNTISCATCHSLSAGGAEPRATSTGIRGQIGPINSPTVLNSAFNFVQFWDGRAADLREQASGPVTNPVEMGAEWPEVLERLGKDEEYVASFQAIYGDAEITEERVVDALAEYESFLVTPSRFDQWLRGEDDALNEEEKKGLRLFVETGCTTCHNGRNLGGNSYQRMGLVHNYFEERGGRITEADLGRYNVTKDEADRHKFKVPTLRNVELTAPYFHDGSVRDLDEAVRSMGRLQLGRELSDADTSSIVAFLRSLTGEIPAEAFPPGAEGEAAPAVAPAAAVPASADPVEAAPAAAPAEAAPAPTPAE